MFVLAGTVVVFMYTIRSVSTDKTTATLTYSYWSILSRGSLSLPFASISSIRFTKIYIRRKKGGRWEAHTVFKQQDGNELDVPQAIGNQDDAKKIADVIGVPFTYDKPPSLVDVFGLAGSAISAGMHKYQQEMEKQPKE
ncbi:hypothetical protein FJZ26_01945 [Candidatus Parvarchaeota archaeon]|nr:hypothetical protein [Candidatus Parvarchaeota archaeon]